MRMQICPSHKKNFILDGIHYILSHNIFNFDGQLYRQTSGTVMGTKFAPSYANLFMGNFEKIMIQLPRWTNNIVCYKRYIDYLFFIWKGDKEEFDFFVQYLNNNEWGLTFTSNISQTNLEYLDLSTSNTTVITKTFFKTGL